MRKDTMNESEMFNISQLDSRCRYFSKTPFNYELNIKM